MGPCGRKLQYFHKCLTWWLASRRITVHGDTDVLVLLALFNLGYSRPGCSTWPQHKVWSKAEDRWGPLHWCGSCYNIRHPKAELTSPEGGYILSNEVRAVDSPSLLPHCGTLMKGRTNSTAIPTESIDLSNNWIWHKIPDCLESLEWSVFQNCLLIYITVRRNSR